MTENFDGSWDPAQEDHHSVSANSYDTGSQSRPPVRRQHPAKFKKKETPQAKLYLYPLNEGHSEEQLNDIFSKFGEVTEVFIDQKKHQWAFVSMKTQAAAERALQELNAHPQRSFETTFAKEKAAEPASVASSHNASPAEANYRNSEAAPQTGSQFINSFKGKQLPPRNIADTSQRLLPNFQFSPSLFPIMDMKSNVTPNVNMGYQKPILTNGNGYSVIPNCYRCKSQTNDSCSKCYQSFCSKDCMILGFSGHTGPCILVPLLTSELKTSAVAKPATSGISFNDIPPALPTICPEFADTSRNYLEYSRNSAADLHNSYNADDIDELGGVRNEMRNSRDSHHRNAAQTSNSRKFESRKPTGDELPKQNENVRTNGAHRTKDRIPNRHSSSTHANIDEEDDARSDFSSATSSGKRNYQAKGEGDGKLKPSFQSSRDDGNFHAKKNRDAKVANSYEQNGFSRNEQANKENESSWNNQSRESGNRSRKETEFSRDHQSSVSGHRPKKGETLDNEYAESRRVSNEKNAESTWDNEQQERSPRKDSSGESSSRNKSSSFGGRSKRESAASRIRQNVSSRESPSENRSPNERPSDDDVCPKRRQGTRERERKTVEFEDDRNYDASPRSPAIARSPETPASPKSECNSPRLRDPEFSPLPRVNITNNAKIQVNLVQREPYAVTIVDEAYALNHMLATLEKFSLHPLDTLEKGVKCAAKRGQGTQWYRCVVHEMEPLRVKFIDFNFEPQPIQKQNLRYLPEAFCAIPPFCYRVNFLNAESYEVDEFMDSKIEVEFVSKDKFVWNVNLVKKSFNEELDEARTIRDAKKQTRLPEHYYPDLRITLKKDVPIEVFVTYKDRESKKIFVTVMAKSQKFMDMITKKDPSSLPELKDIHLNVMCLALFDGGWYRGRIASVEPLRVYYVDFGNTEPAVKNDLRMSPDEFAHVDPLVVAIKFRTESASAIEEYENVEIVPIKELTTEKVWLVRLASEPETLAKPNPVQQPSNEENEPKIAVNTILTVMVTFQISKSEYYVVDEAQSKNVLMDMKDDEVLKRKPLKTPSLGTLCVVKFDSLWSRAKIIKLEPLTVFFIDFGNDHEPEEDLYPMPERLLNIPPMAFKIHLQEPKEIEPYVPCEIRKVSEKLWRVEPPSPPAINSTMDVLILAVEDHTYGVIPIELNNTFIGIQQALMKKKLQLPTVEKPKIGLICAEYTNVVARVHVNEINPLVLYYLDFGFEEIKDSYCNLREIPDGLAEIEPLAFKMILKNEDMELREQQTIRIRILEKIYDSLYFVEAADVSLSDSLSQYDSASEANTTFYDVNSPPLNAGITRKMSRSISPKSSSKNYSYVENDETRSESGSVNTEVLGQEYLTTYPNLPTKYLINEIPVGASFALTVMNVLNDSRCSGMLMQTRSFQIQFMKKYLKNLKADCSYRPKVGDTIAALLPETDVWSRALVLSEPSNLKTKYRVAMFDVGSVHEVEEIAPLNDHRDLSSLSVYCEVKRFPARKKPLKLFKTYNKCKITEKLEDGTIVGCIEVKNTKYEVCFKPWIPTIDELGVTKMPVTNNCEVRIMAYNSSNTAHVCLLDDVSDRIGSLFMSDVADFCEAAEPMTEEPFVSEIVGIEYRSGLFLRGQVLEKLDKEYSIFLLDRGTKCTARLDQLRSLAYSPDSSPLQKYLKNSYAFAIPVTLKHVPVTDITMKVSTYMQSVIENGYKFNLLTDETTGEVELKFIPKHNYGKDIKKEKTLNEYLTNSLTPSWKKAFGDPALDFDDCLLGARHFADDLRYDELPVGSKVSLYVADVSNADFSVVNKNGKNYLKLFEMNLFERLAEYATTVTDSYVPTTQELCIAEHENVWYRALCIHSQPNSDIMVQLIDDGRIVPVSHKNIRKMVSDFCHYPATALLVRPKDDAEFDEKRAKLLVDDTIRVRILEKTDQNCYFADCRKVFAKT